MNSKVKKLIITNLPYLFIALMATKLGLAWRLAQGTDFSEKAMHIMDGLSLAFETLTPSFHATDLFVGLLAGAGIRIAVHVRGKNTKKYGKNMEYGSARWGAYC